MSSGIKNPIEIFRTQEFHALGIGKQFFGFIVVLQSFCCLRLSVWFFALRINRWLSSGGRSQGDFKVAVVFENIIGRGKFFQPEARLAASVS